VSHTCPLGLSAELSALLGHCRELGIQGTPTYFTRTNLRFFGVLWAEDPQPLAVGLLYSVVLVTEDVGAAVWGGVTDKGIAQLY